MRLFVTAMMALMLFGLAPGAQAQAPAPAATPDPEQAALQASIKKLNAYVALLNRSLRAVDAIDRYKSWVNYKTGPTGRERVIYGLYSLYDLRSEIAAAEAATGQEPRLSELDAAVKSYIAAYSALSPVITEANGYYERKDYKDDNMAGGKALHARLVAAAEPFLAERAKLDPLFNKEKADVDMRELAAIEKREGRKARWHVRNVMNIAREVADLLPSDSRPVVDLPTFDAALARYAAAVKEMDAYAAANPNSFFVFESRPRSWLGKLRDFREKLGRAKGDARQGAGRDMTWIVSDYNTMVSTAQSATTFNR